MRLPLVAGFGGVWRALTHCRARFLRWTARGDSTASAAGEDQLAAIGQAPQQ